jgi:hypothetical protein
MTINRRTDQARIHIRLLRAQGVLLVAQPVPDAIEQLRLRGHEPLRGV